jgi:transposase
MPWGRMGIHYSFLLEEKIMRLSREMSMSAIAKEIEEPDNNLWRVFHYYISKALGSELDLSKVTRISVDETASKRGHSYVTIFSDLDTGRVVYVTEGRKKEVFKELYGWLFDKNSHPSNIEIFSMDMSKSYIAGRKAYFIMADEVFDRFHIKKALNGAIDKVRKQEVKDCEELKRTKYMWLKNEVNLTSDEKLRIQNFLVEGTSKTAIAYQVKQSFDQIWKVQKKSMEATLESWLDLAWSTALRPLESFVDMVDRHFNGVLNAIHTGITNGLAEGLNSLFQLAKSRARGFRNIDNFIAMIYFLGNDFKLSFH